MSDCDLEQREDGLWHCKANCGRAAYHKKIRQRCGKQPDLLTCQVCRGPLKKRKRPPELAAWWFWCRACDTFVRECRDCNRKAAGS